MSSVHLLIPSFNAGEISPLMGARFGVEKVASGCRLLRNFIPHVHGPVFRRPGMEFMGRAMSDGHASSLRAFTISTSTSAVLELSAAGLGVWSTKGKVPIDPLSLPYSEAQCAELQTVQVNDVVYIAHPEHPPRRLVRAAVGETSETWELQEIDWAWPALGDENAPKTDLLTAPETLVFQSETVSWPQFTMPAGNTIFSVVDPVLSSVQKTARLEIWDGTQWVVKHTLSWKTSLPAPATITTTNKRQAILTFGTDGNGVPIVGGKLVATQDSKEIGSMNLDPVTVTVSGHSVTATIPASRTPFDIAKGQKWQVSVNAPASLSEGARLSLQIKGSGNTWTEVQAIPMHSNQLTVTKFGGPKIDHTYRLAWEGTAMAGGLMRADVIEDAPPSTDITIACDGTSGDGHTLTASQAIFQPGHVGSFWQISHARDLTSVQIAQTTSSTTPPASTGPATSSELRVAGTWNLFTYGLWATTLYLEQQVGDTWMTMRSWKGRFDRNIVASGSLEAETKLRLRVDPGTAEIPEGTEGPRFVLETDNARVDGLVKILAVGPAADANDKDEKSTTATVNIMAPLDSIKATTLWTEGAWSPLRGYPRTVALHGQRLWFGGTESEPMRLWGSVVNDYENFRRTTLDDASVSFTPAAQTSNPLQWLTSYGTELVMGTSGDEWTLRGGTPNGPITPTSVQVQRRSGHGSAYVPAIIAGDYAIFVQRGNARLRQVSPPDQSVAWSAVDITVLAEHLTKAGIKQLAAMTFPWSILWAVTKDGRLLGMTFEQEQNVFGWHCHETDGVVESVAVIYGEEADEVWLTVRRAAGDGTGAYLRTLERLDPKVFARRFDEPESLIYADCATRKTFDTPTTDVEGLPHLEGKQVTILGDGAELPPGRVLDGMIRLPGPVNSVVVGLPYTSQLQPMRMDLPMRDGTAQRRVWRVSRVGLMLHDSMSGEVADAPDARFEALQYRRVSTPMDAPPPLYTGEIETAIESRAREGADVVVQSDAPLPFNVGAMVLKGDVFGE